MFTSEDCSCSESTDWNPHGILFDLLSHTEGCLRADSDWNTKMHSCLCDRRHLVYLKDPMKTCQAASEVLLKTIRFMKSLPSFHHLPCMDQFSLLRSCWVPLFILGLAQEHLDFEVTVIPRGSILRNILLNHKAGDRELEAESSLLPFGAVQNLKSCLDKFWSLDLSPKEYAYLKGTILFNPDVPNLMKNQHIEDLQQEAQRVLGKVIHTLHPNDRARFSRVLLAASSLHTVAQSFVTELFFKGLIGQTDLLELLVEILFS